MITVVKPDWEWINPAKMRMIVRNLEKCGRVCYKSENRITEDSADKFVEKICRNNHESVLEHETLTARIICSRACSHQLVRHRIAAYSQESMRYCNYGKLGLQVICPPSVGIQPGSYDNIEGSQQQADWFHAVQTCYDAYLSSGCKPEDARYLLPLATKTEVVATFNMRMWRHIFRERALNKHAQWEIRGIFRSILDDLRNRLPSIFGDLGVGSGEI